MIGDRVRHARLYHGWTQQQLADLSGVSQSAIYQIETTGHVADETLQAIADATDFARWWFDLGPLPDLPDGSLRYRKRATATKRDAQRVRAYARHTVEAVERISEPVNLPPVRIKAANDGNEPLSLDEVERWAACARHWMGVGSGDPIRNLTNAAERSGIFVIGFAHELERHDAVSFWPDYPSGRPYVFFSRGHAGDRQRFSIAHEIGHLCLHQTRIVDDKVAEDEANAFAGALLMPRQAAIEDMADGVITLRTLAYAKARWGLSIRALIRRALDLKLIDVDRRTSLEKQYSSRGWKRQEPVNVAEEQPTLMRKLMEAALGAASARQVVKSLGLPAMSSRELVA